MKTSVQPRITSVDAESIAPVLTVRWRSGGADRIDLSGWIATGGSALADLQDPGLFASPQIVENGAAIAWGNPDGDLAIDAFHLKQLAVEQKPFGAADLASWQERAGLSNQEAKDFLGVSLSTFNSYKAGSRIPQTIGMLCRAAQRDPILMQAHYKPRRSGRPRKAPGRKSMRGDRRASG
jgi:hypothetical protein